MLIGRPSYAPPLTADTVPRTLGADGLGDNPDQVRIGGAGAQRAQQIGLIRGEQARAQLAIGCQAKSVAARTEWLGDRADELELAAPIDKAPAASRSGGSRAWMLAKRPRVGNHLPQFVSGYHPVRGPRTARVERHRFDETHHEGALAGESRERENIRLAHASQHHGVHRNRPERRVSLARRETREHSVEIAPPGYPCEALWVQAVDAHVNPAQARVYQCVDVLLQEHAVGGHADLA